MQADSKEDLEDWVKVFNDLLAVLKPTMQVSGKLLGKLLVTRGEWLTQIFSVLAAHIICLIKT